MAFGPLGVKASLNLYVVLRFLMDGIWVVR
jgi:hypothetical protein